MTQLHTKPVKPQSEWLTPQDKRVIKYVAYAGGTLLVGGIAFVATRHLLRKTKAGKAEKETLNEGTPENFAKRLKMAFDNDGWWGTNVVEVRKVFTEIPDLSTFSVVSKKYEELTKQSKGALYRDLEEELTSSEYYEIQSMLKSKPPKPGQKPVFNWNAAYAMVHRIKAAFNYTILGMPSTDKGALESALNAIPSLYAFAMVKVAYKKEYGREIEADLDSELDVFDFSWKKIVYSKPRN